MLNPRLKQRNMCQKLEKILPLVKKNIPELTGLSLGSMVVATTFASSRNLASVFHIPGCPFYSRQLPLSMFTGKTIAQTKICLSCLKKEVHFLSSEAFCDDMEMRCLGETFEIQQVPQQLLSKLINDYGSFQLFVDDLLFFSCNQASPGRTWVVFDGDKISIMNLSSNTVPLVYGLWPLALINMSERYLCDEILALSTQTESTTHTSSQSTQRPFWSRAARNPFSMTSASRHYLSPISAVGIEDGDERLEKIRIKVAKKSVNSMRWSFVNNQLIEATNYFSSPGRRTARSEFRAKQEKEVSLLALRNYKEHNDTIKGFSDAAGSAHSTFSDTLKHNNNGDDINNESKGLNPNSCATGIEENHEKFDPLDAKQKETGQFFALKEEKEGENDRERMSSYSSSENANANTTTPYDSLNPKTIQHADGSWEYEYQNGDRTFLHTDGTKVFQTEDVTTTVRTDGSTLFEYPNGSSILDRFDGIRITTYPDGTSKEEVICP